LLSVGANDNSYLYITPATAITITLLRPDTIPVG